MTNKTKIYIGIGSAVALVGGYFIYKAIRGKKPIINSFKDKTDEEKPPTKDETKTTTDGTIKSYRVTASVLRGRSEPNDTSIIVSRIPKGCILEAVPSSTSGWMEMIKWVSDGKCSYEPNIKYYSENPNAGNPYVSSKYLVEVK